MIYKFFGMASVNARDKRKSQRYDNGATRQNGGFLRKFTQIHLKMGV